MTNSERFVFWLAERLEVWIISRQRFEILQAEHISVRNELTSEQQAHDATRDALSQSEKELAIAKNHESELLAVIKTQFTNASMTAHSGMHGRETQAWWGGIAYACALMVEKLGQEVPEDTTTLIEKFSRIMTV